MSYALTTADRRTHRKIVGVALAGVAMLIAIAANTPPRSDAAKQATALSVVKAGKPVATAAHSYNAIR